MKMSVAENGLKNKKDNIWRILAEVVLTWMVTNGFCVSVFQICGIECSETVLLLAAGVSAICCGCFANMRYGTILAVFCMGGLAAALILVPGEVFLNGMLAAYNALAETLGRKTPCLLETWQLFSEENSLRDREIFAGVCCVLAGILNYVFIKRKKRWTLAVWMLLFVLLAGGFLGQPDAWWTGLYGTGIVGSLLYRSYLHRNEIFVYRNGGAMTLAAMSIVCCVIFGGAVLFKVWMPKAEYVESEQAVEIRERVGDLLERLRYQKGKINSLPKGRVEQAYNWESTQDTALKVTMEIPQSLYLKGFVGSIYKDNGWQDLSRDSYYDNQDLFYWLHQWGLEGNTQLSAMRGLLEEKNLTDKRFSVVVENINADSQYLYAPYELMQMEQGAEEVWGNDGDSYLLSNRFLGSRSYSWQTLGNLVKDFPQMAALGYLYAREHPDSAYVQAESYYNAFVYQQYLEIPSEIRTLLKAELGYGGEKEGTHVDYTSAIKKIRTWLEKNITYGNYGEEVPEGEDFLEFFLTDSQIGNPVHYTTAAVMMFRYYGIPSRYVEGYLITPEDAKCADENGTVEIPGSNGHVWTEIYVDGLGWVPLEMTPEYYGVMEEPDLTKGLQADSTVVLKEPEKNTEEMQQQKAEDLKEKLSRIFLNLGKVLLVLLVLFNLFWLVCFVYVLIRRVVKNCQRRKQFADRDHRRAICSMMGYMTRIMDTAAEKMPKEAEQIYQTAYCIGQKAAFSQHEPSLQERQLVENSKRQLLKTLKKVEGWYDKWILKYIERLY